MWVAQIARGEGGQIRELGRVLSLLQPLPEARRRAGAARRGDREEPCPCPCLGKGRQVDGQERASP